MNLKNLLNIRLNYSNININNNNNSTQLLEKLNPIPKNLFDGYNIQLKLINNIINNTNNNHIIGYKIGNTNKTSQEFLNVNEPFFGVLLNNVCFKSPCINNEINLNNINVKLLEPEIAFKINNDIIFNKNKQYDKNDIINNYVESILPSIEIVHSSFNDWKSQNCPSLIADLACNGYWVYGNEKKLSNIDKNNILNGSLTEYKVKLINNTTNEIKNGKGDRVGDPLDVLYWLINNIPKYYNLKNNDIIIKKNQYVTTGILIDPPYLFANKNEHIIAKFDNNLGDIEIKF